MRSTLVIAALIATLITGVPNRVRASQPAPLPSSLPAATRERTTAPRFLAADRAELLRRLNRFAEPSCDLEAKLFADVVDARLDAFSPLEAALVASGTTSRDQLARYTGKTAHLAEELRSAGLDQRPPRDQVEAVFDFLHRHVLHVGYDLAATDLRQVLDHGRYNCVSATVLFNYLAMDMGLHCTALEMPGHAMSRVATPAGPVDVETTCPRWFDLMHDPQVAHNDLIQTVEHPELGPIKVIGMPVRFSETPGTIRLAPPLVGEHTNEVLRAAGYAPEQIETFHAEGVI